jgi:hypothetical protein
MIKEILTDIGILVGCALAVGLIFTVLYGGWIRLIVKNKRVCSKCGSALEQKMTGKHRTSFQYFVSIFLFHDRLRKHCCCGKIQYTLIKDPDPSPQTMKG